MRKSCLSNSRKLPQAPRSLSPPLNFPREAAVLAVHDGTPVPRCPAQAQPLSSRRSPQSVPSPDAYLLSTSRMHFHAPVVPSLFHYFRYLLSSAVSLDSPNPLHSQSRLQAIKFIRDWERGSVLVNPAWPLAPESNHLDLGPAPSHSVSLNLSCSNRKWGK